MGASTGISIRPVAPVGVHAVRIAGLQGPARIITGGALPRSAGHSRATSEAGARTAIGFLNIFCRGPSLAIACTLWTTRIACRSADPAGTASGTAPPVPQTCTWKLAADLLHGSAPYQIRGPPPWAAPASGPPAAAPSAAVCAPRRPSLAAAPAVVHAHALAREQNLTSCWRPLPVIACALQALRRRPCGGTSRRPPTRPSKAPESAHGPFSTLLCGNAGLVLHLVVSLSRVAALTYRRAILMLRFCPHD